MSKRATVAVFAAPLGDADHTMAVLRADPHKLRHEICRAGLPLKAMLREPG
jgi:hypothetical protein